MEIQRELGSAKEIERKFRLSQAPPRELLRAGETVAQGYLPCTLRVRRKGERSFLTLKGEGMLARDEWESEVPAWVFEQLWPFTEGARLEKTRYALPHGGRTLEVDEYHGRLAGLWTLECEFESEDAARAFACPDWAQDARDVTDDVAYRNYNLARKGIPSG